MSFFTKADTDDKWKTKYLNLLDEQDLLEKQTQEKEALLCKAITRISIAASGLDPQLDPPLQRIRDQLKNRVDSQRLKTELDNFIAVVARLKDAGTTTEHLDSELLFDFLLAHFSSSQQQASFKNLQQQAIASRQQLFAEIARIIDLQPSLNVQPEPGTAVPVMDTGAIADELLRLLDSIEIPQVYAAQTQALKYRFSTSGNAAAFLQLLSDYIDLLIKIDNHPLPEQQDVDRFLAHISGQLTDLGETVTVAAAATQEAAVHRYNLDQSVSSQMQELQNTAINATKLEPLKEDIQARLSTITKEIQQHAQQELLQRQKTQVQLDELTAKVKQMEHESSELKAKLDMAKIQALRDNLTGLPNRIAYKERIEVEVARWKRYRTPLTLIVWDVDHFKVINDTYGHKAGDKALVIIAKQLSEHCRKSDFVSRFGGEEFVMLLANTNKECGLAVADQLRRRIESTGFNSNGNAISITISCGITQFTDQDTDESAFERADQALYKAKQQGRNQCCVA